MMQSKGEWKWLAKKRSTVPLEFEFRYRDILDQEYLHIRRNKQGPKVVRSENSPSRKSFGSALGNLKLGRNTQCYLVRDLGNLLSSISRSLQ
jgi:hypothetical protein